MSSTVPAAGIAATKAPAAIALSGVSKVFGSGGTAVRALDKVTLTAAPGEFTCLIGASGCGKSTLLSLVAGLERPTAGDVSVGGRVALMFQEAALLPWLSAAGNVELALRARGVARPERRVRVAELLETVHLGGFGKKRPHELSGGMRQRVALARALAQDADVLLMDEPFGALDAMTRDLLHEELDSVTAARDLTVLFVTHNVREAVRLGDRVVLLSSRPGTVIKEYPVSVERPRRIDSSPVASWPPPSPTVCAKRWAGMASNTLAGLDALDLPVETAPGGAGPVAARGWRAVWPKLAAIALVLVIWELLYVGGWKHEIFPGPATTLANLWDQASAGLLWHAIGVTVGRAVLGFAIALVIGTVIGLLVARVTTLRAAIGSLLTGLQTMPSVAWIPFAIILFGSSTSTILFVVVMAAAPSIANGLIAGVDYTPPLLIKAARLMGLRGLSLQAHLFLPASLPSYVAGLKQGWAFTWHSLLTAELVVLIANEPSLGILLNSDQEQSDMASTISVMIVILTLGIIVDALFGFANRSMRRRRGIV